MAWVHLIFESYCMYNSCKDKYTTFCQIDWDAKDKKGNRTFKVTSRERKLNPVWEKGRKRPAFCKKKYPKGGRDMTPHPDCQYAKCPFLAMTEVTRSEYLWMMKAWEKMPKKYKEDD